VGCDRQRTPQCTKRTLLKNANFRYSASIEQLIIQGSVDWIKNMVQRLSTGEFIKKKGEDLLPYREVPEQVKFFKDLPQ
jgi:hypothetical protein